VTARRVVTVAVGVAILVGGRLLGGRVLDGYLEAGIIGLGIAIVVIGLGRREPYLLRRWRGDDPDEPGTPEDAAAPKRWPEW
jgi:hypothetical protein